ncbi:phytoene/squalene synthetase [Corynebacterium glutamicum]|nr:phytoene/squalene synthetase [Corynebacterium glutamicum]
MDAARLSIRLLPFGERAGGRAASNLYDCLVDNWEPVSLDDLKTGRISVASLKRHKMRSTL